MPNNKDKNGKGGEKSSSREPFAVSNQEPSPTDEAQKIHQDADGLLETDDHQSAEIRRIFGTTFPQYFQPIEEIVEQLFNGRSERESFQALLGMLSSLKKASSRMEFENVHTLLLSLQERISSLEGKLDKPVSQDVREAILGDIFELKELALQMGGEDQNFTRERSQSIFQALKDQEGVGDLVLRRLSAAGLITVDQLLSAHKEEIAAVTGLGLDIVQKVMDLLSKDRIPETKTGASEQGTPKIEANNNTRSTGLLQDGQPTEVESLHQKVLENLKIEVESEAEIEDLKAEIRRMRARISACRAELVSLEEGLPEKKRLIQKLADRLAERATLVDEKCSKRDALARKCASSEENVRRGELKLEMLNQEQQSLEKQAAYLGRSINGLVDMFTPIRRLLAK